MVSLVGLSQNISCSSTFNALWGHCTYKNKKQQQQKKHPKRDERLGPMSQSKTVSA